MGAGSGKNKRVKSSLHSETRVANKTYLTNQIIRSTVSRLAEETFQNKPKPKENNFILNALTTQEERQDASNIHSMTIKIGYFFEELFNELAKANPNLKVMPRERLSSSNVTKFNSKLKYDRVSKAADQITRTFHSMNQDKQTGEALANLINKQRDHLNANPLNFDKEGHTYYADSAFVDKINKEIYLIEAKSSANLDSKKAPDELRNLLKACLALDPKEYPTVHPIAICLYDDPANSLKKAFPSDGVYTGVNWVKLIDNNVDFDKFEKIVNSSLVKLKEDGKLFTE